MRAVDFFYLHFKFTQLELSWIPLNMEKSTFYTSTKKRNNFFVRKNIQMQTPTQISCSQIAQNCTFSVYVFFSISRSVSIRRTIKFKWNMVKWKYRFANSHILVLIPNKTCSKKYSFATTYKSKQKALLDSDLECSTYSEVDTHQNRQTEWAGMVEKKIYVNVFVCVWCKKWKNHSAFQSVCFHVTFFVWSRLNYQ